MNNFTPEDLLKIAKHIHQRDVLAAQLMHKPGYVVSSKLLGAIGKWMVVSGEKLQNFHAESLQKDQLHFSQTRTEKARA